MVFQAPIDKYMKTSITFSFMKKNNWFVQLTNALQKISSENRNKPEYCANTIEAFFRTKLKNHTCIKEAKKEVSVHAKKKQLNPFALFSKMHRARNNQKKWTSKELGKLWNNLSPMEKKEYMEQGREPKPKFVNGRLLANKHAKKRNEDAVQNGKDALYSGKNLYKEDPEFYKAAEEEATAKVREYYLKYPDELDAQKIYCNKYRKVYIAPNLNSLIHKETFDIKDVDMVDGMVWARAWDIYCSIKEKLESKEITLQDPGVSTNDVKTYNNVKSIVDKLDKICKRTGLTWTHFYKNPDERVKRVIKIVLEETDPYARIRNLERIWDDLPAWHFHGDKAFVPKVG